MTVGEDTLVWIGAGYSGELSVGEQVITITSNSDTSFMMLYHVDLVGPDATQSRLSILEGRSGWELYMAGAHGVDEDFIPQETGYRKLWVSEISARGRLPHSAEVEAKHYLPILSKG